MALSLTPLLRVMQNLVTGPRDWYHIEHCKTGKNKSYFSVRICVWRDDWPVYSDGESVHLNQAIAEAIEGIEETEPAKSGVAGQTD